MGKTLVAYFSASGVTASVARAIAEVSGGDLFEIAPVVPYSTADLDWTDKKSRSTIEMNDESSRPEFSGSVDNMSDYSTVFVGYPIWWGVEPRIIDTFLEAYDFSGKTIVPFATSGGSGLGSSPNRIQSEAPTAKVTGSKLLNGHQSADSLRSWIDDLAL